MAKYARVLVTGARGFVGRCLVASLLQQDMDIVCLDRTEPGHDLLSRLDVRRVTGDVRDPRVVRDAVAGVDAIFHLAAATAPRTLAEARAVNVEGSKKVGEVAAQQETPPTLVFVSSLAVAGPNPTAVTERDECRPVSLYGRSKWEAENALVKMSGQLPLTIVRPPCVFGAEDRNMLSLFKSVHRGWNVYTDPTYRYSFLHVEDLASALVVALQKGHRVIAQPDPDRTGVYYVAEPQAVTFPELGTLVAQCLGRERVRQLRIAPPVGWIAATWGELLQKVAGRRVYFNRDKAREAYGGSWMCDATRAQQELGVKPAADLTDRLAETAAGYRKAGWLPARAE